MLTNSEMIKIASLAKLSLEGEDISELAGDMTDILGIINSINSAELSQLDCSDDLQTAGLREDIAACSLPVEDVLKNAGAKRDGYFAGFSGRRAPE